MEDMNKLKNELNEIIQKKSNFSKLTYEINIAVEKPANADQFPNRDFSFKKIDIVCKEAQFDSFTKFNNEIKEVCKDIEQLNSTHFVSFNFEKCDIKFWNENINLGSHINFIECEINVNVQDVNLDEIYLLFRNFHNCKFKNLSLLSNIKTVHIDLHQSSIDLMQLVKIEILDNGINKIEIKNSHIKRITIKEAIFKRDFTIYETTIDSIRIENVDFESLSEFNEVTFQSEFDFKEITYNGLTLFDRCIFNAKAEFEYIIFEKFTSFRGTTFNKGLNLDFTSAEKEINFFGIKGLKNNESIENTSQETYRIIKYNFEKIGNKIEANKYHALELDQKRRELEKNKWNNKKDYLVFKLHSWSSEHSTNWSLALLWIFAVGFLTVFSLHLGIAKDLFFHPNHFKIEYIGKIFSQFFKFIYIGNMDDILKNNSFIFLLNKVLLGYLYYQFLISVRKDTRK
ncbi:hypothetical protein FJR48_06690 [Sulfurimonas lithotrophica]|uniref:Pentapeptide repeat protein n=1 Tax=Sulfurimonas lithotrophica TaxID=2590022 RepID=A0A5P8P161_9BACT|nr:hypothetical protein [Sulfurimonas lithotrophica]QFR49429.1 hypothetical protein FJR48_06690 [Sulfurimonas lithotrophica]